MPQLRTLADISEALKPFIPSTKGAGAVYSLERMTVLMAALGNPQDKLKVIHVAGTSGKTSTSYYIAAMLTAAGHTVGLSISPHTYKLNERVQIDMQPLEEGEFGKQLEQFFTLVKNARVKPTYFELLVAFVYWYFDARRVEYAVIEVGLGGLLDATNVVSRSDKVCVITDIGLDHTQVLGSTLEKITGQKAGIIQPHNHVLMHEQTSEIMAIVYQASSQKHATLHVLQSASEDDDFVSDLPLFLQRNWSLAEAAAAYVLDRDNYPALSQNALDKAKQVVVPARMEIVQRKGKTIIFDVAHNGQKMAALEASIKAMFPGKKIASLIGIVQSEDFKRRTDLARITGISQRIIITSFSDQQDDRVKTSIDPALLAKYCKDIGFDNAEVIEDPRKAMAALLESPQEVLLVTGSVYLMAHVRELV